MTDSQTPESKQGPPNPNAEGLEAPSPPGGPLRQDHTGQGRYAEGHDDEASASRANDRHAEEAGGHTIPIEDEQPDPHPEREAGAAQQENAETSLHQPSEG
jgi:hypothetical protein